MNLALGLVNESERVPDRVRFPSAMAVAAARKCLMVLAGEVVSLNFASWNQIGESLRRVEALRDAAWLP